MGIDPGVKNLGAVILEPGQPWSVQTLRLDGSYRQRQIQLFNWIRANIEGVEYVGIEALTGGMPYLQQKLAAIPAVFSVAVPSGIKLAEIMPSTHYKFISGRGKPSDEYDAKMDALAGFEMDRHQRTAGGCAMMMLAYQKKKLTQFYLDRIRWLT